MKVVFTIPYPKTSQGKREWNREYGLNAIYSGKHWSKRKRDSEYWHCLTRAELKRQGIAQKLFCEPVCITFFWNDRLDLSNHAYMGKMIEDALRGYLLQDDTRKFVREICHRWHQQDCVLVEITSLFPQK